MDRVTVMPRERQRALRFALALDGAEVPDPALAPMLRLAQALAAGAGPAPTDEFRTALRRRLFAVAAVSAADARSGSGFPADAAPAGSGQQTPWRRSLVAAGTALAITTGGAAATAVASTSALPGDTLYDVKRTVESIQLALATSELARGERHLAIAATRLDEVGGLLEESGPRPTDPVVIEKLRKTLGSMGSSTELGSEQFFSAYRGRHDAVLLRPLDGFLREQSQDLASLTPLLPPELLDSSRDLMTSFGRIAAQVAALTGGAPAVSLPGGAAPSSSSTAARSGAQDAGRPDAALSGLAGAGEGAVPGAVSDAVAGATSQVPGQGLVGLDVDPSKDDGPGVSLHAGSGSTDLPAPLPNTSVGVNAPEEKNDLLGGLQLPSVSDDALPGGSLPGASLPDASLPSELDSLPR